VSRGQIQPPALDGRAIATALPRRKARKKAIGGTRKPLDPREKGNRGAVGDETDARSRGSSDADALGRDQSVKRRDTGRRAARDADSDKVIGGRVQGEKTLRPGTQHVGARVHEAEAQGERGGERQTFKRHPDLLRVEDEDCGLRRAVRALGKAPWSRNRWAPQRRPLRTKRKGPSKRGKRKLSREEGTKRKLGLQAQRRGENKPPSCQGT